MARHRLAGRRRPSPSPTSPQCPSSNASRRRSRPTRWSPAAHPARRRTGGPAIQARPAYGRAVHRPVRGRRFGGPWHEPRYAIDKPGRRQAAGGSPAMTASVTITFNNPAKRNAHVASKCGKASAEALAVPRLRDDGDPSMSILLTGAGGAGLRLRRGHQPVRRRTATTPKPRPKRTPAAPPPARELMADYPKPTIAVDPRLLHRRRPPESQCRRISVLLAEHRQPVRHPRGQAWASPTATMACATLVSLVGPSQARLLMYTGMRIDRAKRRSASAWWTVSCRTEAVWPTAALEMARTIAANAPLAIKAAKVRPSPSC